MYQKSWSYGVCLLRYGSNHTIFCHFGSLFALLSHYLPQILKIEKKNKEIFPFSHVPNKLRFLRYKAQQTEIFVILGHFLPFYSTNKPKNQNFEKMKKSLGDIIILHLSTTNDNHIVYGSWDMEFNRQNLLSFWTFFLPFYWKIKFLKKVPGHITSLHLLPQMTIIWCMVP